MPELVAFPTVVYLMLDQGFIEAEQVRSGGGVQFRPVRSTAARPSSTDPAADGIAGTASRQQPTIVPDSAG